MTTQGWRRVENLHPYASKLTDRSDHKCRSEREGSSVCESTPSAGGGDLHFLHPFSTPVAVGA